MKLSLWLPFKNSSSKIGIKNKLYNEQNVVNDGIIWNRALSLMSMPVLFPLANNCMIFISCLKSEFKDKILDKARS